MRILITGYAGFIGSNLTRMIYSRLKKGDQILGLDAYTYAARPEWALQSIKSQDDRFMATKVDLRQFDKVAAVVEHFKPDQVYHLAAESHVCKSIEGPRAFIESNVLGTFNLIEALRQSNFDGRMVHVSTDEVYGELKRSDEPFDVRSPLRPTSPYSASKAGSDLIVRAFVKTYGLNAMITNCTNNYGPNQHLEKLIPRTIDRFMKSQPMTVYGSGLHTRDWIHVDDHCEALMLVMKKGMIGNTYLIGSGLELTNLKVITEVGRAIQSALNREIDCVVEHTDDRPTDDQRYAVSTDHIESLGWKPNKSLSYFRAMLIETVRWYSEHSR